MDDGMCRSVNLNVAISDLRDIEKLKKLVGEVEQALTGTARKADINGTITNFGHMKERMLHAVSSMDEAELWQMASDTCMDEGGTEGIFSCALCEEVYGDCDTIPGGNGCAKKYLDWCRREYSSEPAWEDKEEIVGRLSELLKATRMGSDMESLTLSEDRCIVTVRYMDGVERHVNVTGDSGYAIIKDVLNALR